VGNVEGVLVRSERGRSKERMFLRGGVVGHHLPVIRPATVPLSAGDVLVFATDGIRADFSEHLDDCLDRAPDESALGILREYGKANDDALVLVARYHG
jgi:hypothetical protein